MSRKLPPSASVTTAGQGAKLEAPAATRNMDALCDLLRACAPERGRALELASGTGQHVVGFARTRPGLVWQPTDVAPDRIASIDAHVQESALANILPARFLNAAHAGWHRDHRDLDLVVLVNLLHLISRPEAHVVVEEAALALSVSGMLVLYGPFKRNGDLTSDGDARFDATLRASDPAIGYKNDDCVRQWLKTSGLSQIKTVDMPANNLAFIACA